MPMHDGPKPVVTWAERPRNRILIGFLLIATWFAVLGVITWWALKNFP